MDFLIVPKNLPAETLHNRTKGWRHTGNDTFDLYYDPRQAEMRPWGSSTLFLLGDFWNVPEPAISDNLTGTVTDLVKALKGNYYGIILEKEKVHVFSCFLNLMPVFYSPRDRVVTSVFPAFGELQLPLTVSERYIFEALLFNYPFFNHTIFNEVKLLSTHHLLSLDNHRAMETEFFNTRVLFTESPAKGKKVHDALADAFIRTVDDYIPGKGSVVTFTGGFDGRTIVSCALHLRKEFKTLAFGKAEDEDVHIPYENAKELGLEFIHLESSDTLYITRQYSEDSIAITRASGGFNGFLYPHFLYIARESAKHGGCLVTGCGGSELFRAAHNAGAVVSQALYDVLTIEGEAELKNALLASPKIKILQKEVIENVIGGFMEDLVKYRRVLNEFETTNRKLYYFMHNETLRKLFGIWIYNQAKYINVRSPFLDYRFIEAVYRSDLAGAYNAFFTHNPIRRFKGHWLYSVIIGKTNRKIFNQKTGKGYPPKYILTPAGRLKLVIPFFKRRLIRRVTHEDIDNLGILSGLNYFIKKANPINDLPWFDQEEVLNLINQSHNVINEADRDILLQFFSINSIVNTK